MKTHTNDFKNAIKTYGRELDSKITYTLNNEEIELGNDDLNSVSIHYEGGLLKSVMIQLDIDSNTDIPLETVLTYQFGVKVDNAYEYLNYGDFIVYSSKKQEDTGSYKITCYDKMLNTMVDYNNDNITYPITIKNYISTLCTKLNLTFANASDTFPNYDKEIPSELYLSYNEESEEYSSLGFKFRDVFDDLAEVTASTICINSNGELELRYINDTNDIIDEDYFKNINVNFGEKYGPVNSIVLSRSAESDNIYLRDEQSVTQNGLCEIKIIDNQIMNGNDRDEYLQDILDTLDGLEYYLNDYSSQGICYYDLCDKYTASVNSTNYTCIMFNDEINVTQGLEELINTTKPENTTTDYSKADKTDRRINQTYIIANKQQGEIEALVSSVQTLDTAVNNNYQELTDKFNGYVPQSQFVTLENSVTQLQTDTYTKTEINTKLTDGSVTKVLTTAGTFDSNGLTIEKTNAKSKGRFNEQGILVTDATGNTDEELLFAGYDNDMNESVVRTKNINVAKYLNVGTHSRFQDYEDGTGCFYMGGNE